MKRKVFVLAGAFDRISGRPVGSPREELIDTKRNKLFRQCQDIIAVKKTYEGFWNDLNPQSKEVVFVQSIREPFDNELTRKAV